MNNFTIFTCINPVIYQFRRWANRSCKASLLMVVCLLGGFGFAKAQGVCTYTSIIPLPDFEGNTKPYKFYHADGSSSLTFYRGETIFSYAPVTAGTCRTPTNAVFITPVMPNGVTSLCTPVNSSTYFIGTNVNGLYSTSTRSCQRIGPNLQFLYVQHQKFSADTPGTYPVTFLNGDGTIVNLNIVSRVCVKTDCGNFAGVYEQTGMRNGKVDLFDQDGNELYFESGKWQIINGNSTAFEVISTSDYPPTTGWQPVSACTGTLISVNEGNCPTPVNNYNIKVTVTNACEYSGVYEQQGLNEGRPSLLGPNEGRMFYTSNVGWVLTIPGNINEAYTRQTVFGVNTRDFLPPTSGWIRTRAGLLYTCGSTPPNYEVEILPSVSNPVIRCVRTACGNIQGIYTQTRVWNERPDLYDEDQNRMFYWGAGDPNRPEGWYIANTDNKFTYYNNSNATNPPATGWQTFTSDGISCSNNIGVFENECQPCPTNTASISYAGSPYCGSVSNALPTIEGTKGGSFRYTDANDDISIVSETGAISSSIAGTYHIVYTIDGANGCPGAEAKTGVVVNPTPSVNTITSQTVCSNTSTTAVTFSGSVTGTVYKWTNNTTSIGLAASGTGDIAAFTATNTTSAPVTATITVTPSYTNGGVTCDGTPKTFTITVNPTPSVNTISNQTICNNSNTTAVSFSSPTTGGTIVYKWTNNTTSIGLAASGTGDIAAFTVTNTTGAPVTATITVRPSYTNGGVTCDAPPKFAETFTIMVNPTPTISCPSDIIKDNETGKCGAAITYSSTPTGTPMPTITYKFEGATTGTGSGNGSGSFFNVGITTVTLYAENTCGKVSCSFKVTVKDAEKPKFTACPTDITKNNDAGVCGAKVDFTVTATDNCTTPQAISQTAGLASGATFPVGVTTNTFTATDGAGNVVATPCTFKVTVVDAEKPKFTVCPTDITKNNDAGVCGAKVDFTVTAADNCTTPQAVSQTAGLASGATFPVGVTTNTFTATDGAGNVVATPCTFKVTIIDNEKPTISCPASQTITLGSFECGRPIIFTNPSVSDNCSATFERTDAFKTSLKSGSSFGAGTYPLSYRVTDAAGNFADCNFTIQVNGQLTTGRLTCIPTLTVSLDERQCTNTIDAAGLLINNTYYCASSYSASIAGRTSATLSSADIGKTFTVTVRDNSNNNCSTVVTIVDTKAPVLNAPLDASISCTDVSRDGRILTTLSQPTIVYECGRTTFTTQDRVINLPAGQTSFNTRPDGFPTDKNFDFASAFNASRIIVRTYTATDESNNTSSVQQVIYVKNIELSQVQCPKDVTLSCTQSGFSTDIQSTGTPFVSNGRLTQDVSCGIDYLYSDERTNNAQGYTIKRTWTLIARSNNQRQTCTQTITINCANTPLLAISGNINKETGENVPATVKVFQSNTAMMDMQGSSYLFNQLQTGNSYRIQPERDNDVMNGVTTFDIALLSKHILDIQPFTSPYQIIAADVNRDGNVDASDMVLIRNLILRRITRFPSNTAWRFIPKSFVFADNKNPFADDFPEVLNYTNLSSNMEKADFVAVKVGDVNLNARAANVLSLATRTARPTENIYLTDKKMEAGKEYVFDVNIKNSTLKALQLALKIDKSNVTSFTVQNGNLPEWGSGNVEINEKEGIIAAAWANTSKGTVLDENSIIQLKITPRRSAWLHELVSLDAQNMENLAYDTDRVLGEGGIEKELQLKYNTVKTDNVEFELHQNRPNPFIAETTISFILPETSKAELSIYDVNGRVVYTINKAFNKGYNEVKLDNTVLKNAGIYFYRLQSDQFSATKRMQFFIN